MIKSIISAAFVLALAGSASAENYSNYWGQRSDDGSARSQNNREPNYKDNGKVDHFGHNDLGGQLRG